jgi:hypothetical protein
MAQASRLPKLVPVFQAIFSEELNCCHLPSSPGRYSSESTLKVDQMEEGANVAVEKGVVSDAG